MNNIYFEKVSFEQFEKDLKAIYPSAFTDGMIRAAYDMIILPKRSTVGAIGYDFFSPLSFALTEKYPVILIPTGIRVHMDQGVGLFLMPRSGLGFKTGMSLSNTIGLIDPDYYYADNEGHIMAKLERGFKDLDIDAGDRFMQGVFIPCLTTSEESLNCTVRTGGFGSTGL